ncbi:cytochrome b [Acuticoccus mangrovi]|uniref:Cytochrome b n=1 Tax=Acuticoccus mangrovi TaxID=2796142 RepID=A0A934IGS1_9HYPH|nr:cytochrome b [Acuticoccus mangrovi]MBJ3776163.1 cytochrome b [Acuticoccus mangrovi]
MAVDQQSAGRALPVAYSAVAKGFHWITVLAVAALLALGFWMASRAEANVWGSLTDTLFASHKIIGFTLLWFTAARLLWRLFRGAPPAAVSGVQKLVAAITHWGLYAVLIAVPLSGWAAVSAFPALNIFGLFDLPALISPDKEAYGQIIEVHETLVWVLIVLAVLHIAAALYHGVVRRDGVFSRMWPRSL